MNRSRFSEQQIAYILRQAEEGTSVEEVLVAYLSLDKEMLKDVIRRKI